MSTDVASKPEGTPSESPANRFVGASAHRSLRQAFPKTMSDKYRLGEELGRGAYGHVFRGLDTRTGQHVAIKRIGLERIPAGGLPGIIKEVELLKALSHPNVVKYLGSLRTETHLYIVLEYMENGALSSVIKPSSFGPFPETLVAVYIQQVLQGLAYLHSQGVVHRDIKGANILTTKEGVVKLADFGVAAKLSDLDGASARGATARAHSSPVGTAYWMAPEVVELASVTPACDIWSVGCLAIELFTGAPPYYDLQPMSALYNIVADPHPPLPRNISASMRDFLLRCFAKDPASRPSAAELAEHPWAARAAELLCSSAIGACALLTADALPLLLDLLASGDKAGTAPPLPVELTQAALDCCWLLVHRAATSTAAADAVFPELNAVFRCLAHHGLPQRMTAVLPVVLHAYRGRAGMVGLAGTRPVGAGHSRSASVPLTETELANLAEEGTGSGEGDSPRTPSRSSSPHGVPNLSATIGPHRRGASPGSALPLASRLATTHSMRNEESSSAAAVPLAPRSPNKRHTPPTGRMASVGNVEAAPLPPTPSPAHPSPLPLLDAIINLYAAMVHGDGVVKAALVQRAVLAPLFSVTAALPPGLALTVVSAVRALTTDPGTLDALADASGVAFLVAQLARAGEPLLQDQALSALHNMAASDKSRQEQAAVAGAVPFLCQLGLLPQRGAVAAHAHGLAVSLLCSLACGGARARAELWAHDALSVFLHLLKDEACQVEVLDALAAWLAADTARIEARLATGDALTRLVTLVPVMATAGESDALVALLAPLQRLLTLSPRMARELAQNGLIPRITELLRRPGAATTLPALGVLRALITASPQPRALAARFRLPQLLLPLASQPGMGESVADLLQAIQA